MNHLQITLLSNALFSLLSGISLIVFPNTVANWLGQQNSTVFRIIGIGLLYFSYSVFVQVKKPKPDAVFYIIVQDMVWVLLSIILLIVNPFNISAFGNEMIAGVAFIVLVFGVGQSIGLTKIDSTHDKGVKKLTFERVVSASKESTWEIISDVSNYHKIAPNIDTVKIISGEDKGMVRECSHGNDRWTEKCTLWEEGQKYSFEVNTSAEDYPYPLNYLKGTWEVKQISEMQTNIIMTFEFRYKRKIYNFLLHLFMKKKFNEVCEELLDNWENHLKNSKFG